MLGTLVNVAAVLVGTAVGMLFGGKFSEKLRNTILAGLGVFTFFLGISMFLDTQNSIIVLSGLVIGTCLGEWWKIEEGLERFGSWLQEKFESYTGSQTGVDRKRFIQAFLTATLLYCIGPMAILGSIQDGLGDNIQLLVIKSILDGITAIAFASTMGVGVAFSIIPIFIYQGLITLLAVQADAVMSESMITEMSAVGGVMLGALSLSSLLEMKKIRVSSMLPALVITPLIAWLITLF